jgi:sugar lactone lactonase YvrE
LLLAGLTAARALGDTGSTAANRVLGQADFIHHLPNTVDAASMSNGDHLAVDSSVNPNRVYVVDEGNSRVLGYKDVTTLVNGGPADLVIGQPDFFTNGCNTGGVSARSLCVPKGVAVDKLGNLYVGDNGNNRVLSYPTPFDACGGVFPCVGGPASLVWGQGGNFTSNACNNLGSRPTARSLCNPVGVVVDSSLKLYVADANNNRVLVYNSGSTTANVVFGQGGDFTTRDPNKGGLSANSLFSPDGVVLDSGGHLYVSDFNNNRVLEYDTPLSSTTANRVFGQLAGFNTNFCNIEGVTARSLCTPDGIAVDGTDGLIVADWNNSRVLVYSTPLSSDTASLVFGQGGAFNTNQCNKGGVSADSLCAPDGVGSSNEGLYIVDRSNNRVLKYPLDSTTATVVLGQSDFVHNAPNTIDPSAFSNPFSVAIDASAAPNHLYVADTNNSRVLGYLNAASFLNGQDADLVIGQPDFFAGNCNNGGLNASSLCNPVGLLADGAGNLYVADTNNNRVLFYPNPFVGCGGVFPCVGGPATAVWGQLGSFTTGFCNNGGPTPTADSLCRPEGVGLDSNGNVYIADFNDNRVLEYTGGSTTANLVFGQGGDFTTNTCNQGGISANSLCNPAGVKLDTANNDNLYVADESNHRVLEYDSPLSSGTTATNVYGQLGNFNTNFCNPTGVGPRTLCSPVSVALDFAGNLWVADSSNNRVLQYDSPPGNDIANNVFGQNGNLFSSSCNLGGLHSSTETLCSPGGVVLDPSNNLYVADSSNHRVLEYDQPLP